MRRVTIIAVIILTIAATGIGAWLLRPTSGKAATISTVMQRAQTAQQRLLAGLGPNSTLHVTLKISDTSAAGSHISDQWFSFDASGNGVAFTGTATVGGRVESRGTLVNGRRVITDETTGQTTDEGPFNRVTAASLRQNYALFGALVSGVNATSPAQQATYQGHTVYEITSGENNSHTHERLYIDTTTDFPVRVETIDAAGAIVDYIDPVVFEVLPGIVTPTPAAGPVATRTATVATATPTVAPPLTATATP